MPKTQCKHQNTRGYLLSFPQEKKPELASNSGHTSAKTFNHLAAGSTKFTLGETYSIYLNGELYETFTISDITTVIGNNHNNFNNNFHR